MGQGQPALLSLATRSSRLWLWGGPAFHVSEGLGLPGFFTIREADKLMPGFENTLLSSSVLFFPRCNDIITSYNIGSNNEANRNTSKKE